MSSIQFHNLHYFPCSNPTPFTDPSARLTQSLPFPLLPIMNSLFFSPSPSSLGLFILSVLVLFDFPVSLGNPSGLNLSKYNTCSKEFNCGNITGLSYPFWGGDRPLGCGHLELQLHCQDDGIASIEIKGVKYRVLSWNKDAQTLKIARLDFLSNNGICAPLLANTTLDSKVFDYAGDNYEYITFVYGCPSPQPPSLPVSFIPHSISCLIAGIPQTDGYVLADAQPQGPGECNVSVSFPVLETLLWEGGTKFEKLVQIIEGAIGVGFEVRWKLDEDGKACRKCLESKGVCGYDLGLNQTTCYCKDQTQASTSKTCTATATATATVTATAIVTAPAASIVFAPATAPSTTIPTVTAPATAPTNIPTVTAPATAPAISPIATRTAAAPIVVTATATAPATDTASPPSSQKSSPLPPRGVGLVKKIIIGISAGVAVIIVLFAVTCCLRREGLAGKKLVFWKKKTEDYQNVEEFIRNCGSLAPKRYKYSDVKKMTNSFTSKLGEGGFGCVYKGKLSNGSPVAVKLLNNSKGSGEDFINEVASISRTSHVNVVTLVGFCFEGTRRALIYEFMPNGSLDKFIFDRGSSNENLNLEWTTMYQIAVGIARGLEYLYRGCNTRILHFDIKPHNILLDEDFCPRISDFGLAKLCQRKESMVSMTQPRGTVGYIAPEVYCRNFGGVSHKSDVYSYGMLVLEMLGGRKNIDAHVSHTSQIHFPTWIYKQLQPGEDLTALHTVTNTEEEETARKMVLVSFWCIQLNPSDRPSIDKVVEMLEGSLESLEIPPNPFLFPAENAAQDLSTSS